MRRASLMIVWWSMMLSGCNSSEPGGVAECNIDSECSQTCDSIAGLVRMGSGPVTFGSSQCALLTAAGTDAGAQAGCRCIITDQSEVDLIPGSPDGCMWRGHNGDCVYHNSDFPGCDLAAANSSCNGICSDLQMRLTADSQ